MNPTDEHSVYSKRIWWILAAVALLRIVYVVLFPFDLSGDEAYYWDWGRRLSWGYFSKPPFIAWLMALAGWLGGNTDTGIRLMAVFLGTGSLVFCYLISRQLFGSKAAFWAVLLTLASPGNVALNLILTIDAPLMFFWCGALLFFYNQVHNCRYPRLWWLLTTSFLGFGLLSKQMMFVFYPLAAVYLSLQPETRAFLKKPGLYASWLVSLAFMVPTLIWNAQHQWITVAHTQHHFEGKSTGLLDILGRVGEFIGTQLAVISPVTGVAVIILLVSALRQFKQLNSKARYLMVFSAPGLILVTLLLLHQSINPNWPAVFYASLLILLGAAVSGSPELPESWKHFWPKWRWSTTITGLVFATLIMLIPYALEWTRQTGSKIDPVVRLEGWSDLADQVQKVREIHSSELNNPFILATGHRYTTSHLAFYLIDQPRVYHWPENPGHVESQYELWGFDDELSGRDAFIVVPGKDANLPENIHQVFESIRELEKITVTRSAKRTRYYTLYIGKGLKLTSQFLEVTQ